MATVSWEPGWNGPSHYTLATGGKTNLTTFLLSNPSSLNSTGGDGSFLPSFHHNTSSDLANTTVAPPGVPVRDPVLARAEIAILGLIMALTTLGNGFVLWVLLRRRKHHAPMHFFMVNLCLADLVVAFFQVLPQMMWDITERFQGPDALCRLVKYLQVLGMFASSFMIVAMTVDRHYAICCPLQAYRGGATSRCNTPIVVAWGLALVLSLPQIFIFSKSEMSPGEYECWGNFAEPWGLKAYVTWMTVAVFVLPALVITVCQVRIFREIHNNIYMKTERGVSAQLKKNSVLLHFHSMGNGWRKRSKEGGGLREGRPRITSDYPSICSVPLSSGPQAGFSDSSDPTFSPPADPSVPDNAVSAPCYSYPSSNPPATPPGVSKAMSKTVRMTLVIVLVYTICWSPFFIVQLWAAWDPNPPNQGVAFTILMLLASLNSCTNPWIYTAFSSSMSRELQALLRCRPSASRRASLPDDSTTTHTSTTAKDMAY